MCGIIGKIGSDPVDRLVFERQRDTLVHRGPDGAGAWYACGDRVALGHRRLSIVDLSVAGQQPMANEDGTLWLVFNGEIYNAPPLRAELEAAGHRFGSRSDSEVLLHGYEEWGKRGLLHRLKGMFAFAIYDVRRRELFAARDRFGIKPFVYTHAGRAFSFASELKALRADPAATFTVAPTAIADYFTYSYVPHPYTIFEEAKKLPPAHYLVFQQESGTLAQERYWSLPTGNDRPADHAAVARFDELLYAATDAHFLSDVPVGLFLSGGYDSGALALYAHQLHRFPTAYSLGFEGAARSEHAEAAAVAQQFGLDHHVEMLDPAADPLPALRDVYAYYDEPYAATSLLTYHYVSAAAARTHKVVLAGDGGDELLAGYGWHYAQAQRYGGTGWKGLLKRLRVRLPGRFLADYNRRMMGARNHIFQQSFLAPRYRNLVRQRGLWYFAHHDRPELAVPRRTQWLDTHTFMLEACLMRADQSAMRHGLEVRVPFLDHALFEYLFSLDPSVYFKPGIKKFLLYENIKRHLPGQVLNMPKRGFSYRYLERLLSPATEALLRGGRAVVGGYVLPGLEMSELHPRLKLHWLMLELWLEQHQV